MEELMSILKDLRPDVDFTQEKKLIDDGVLDSFDMVSLIGELNECFDINISVDDMVPENFNSAAQIHKMVERLQNAD